MDLVIPWIVLTKTDSPLQLGLVTVCAQIPVMLFSIPAGTYIEGKNKKMVGLISELFRALVMGSLVIFLFLDIVNTYFFGVVLFLSGISGMTFRIASNSMIPRIVGRDKLMEANIYIEGADAVSTLIGPILAGMIFQRFGAGVTVGLNVAAILFSFVGILLIRESRLNQASDTGENVKAVSFFEQTREGFFYLIRSKYQRILAMHRFTLNFITMFVVLSVIIYAKNSLHLTMTQTGFILSSAGAGNIAGIFIMNKFKHKPWITLMAVLLIISSLGIVVMVSSQSIFLICIGMFLFDGALSMAFIVQGSISQAVTPDYLLARIGSTNFVIAAVAALLGNLLSGVIPEYFTSSLSLWTAVFILLLAYVFTVLNISLNQSILEVEPMENRKS